MTIKEKCLWVESQIGTGILVGMGDDCFEFYYNAMHDHGFSFSEADGWAWLNTLFGYDIGPVHSREIINWLYENGQNAMDMDSQTKGTLQNICEFELGLNLDFKNFATVTPEAIQYTWNEGVPMKTYNITLSATYTVNAKSNDEAIRKAKMKAEFSDFDAGYSDIEELEYDPEFD